MTETTTTRPPVDETGGEQPSRTSTGAPPGSSAPYAAGEPPTETPAAPFRERMIKLWHGVAAVVVALVLGLGAGFGLGHLGGSGGNGPGGRPGGTPPGGTSQGGTSGATGHGSTGSTGSATTS